MSRLLITDLNFVEVGTSNKSDIQGGDLTPFPSTALATDLDTQSGTRLNINGNLPNGFILSTFSLGSATGAAAAAASVFGDGTASAFAEVIKI